MREEFNIEARRKGKPRLLLTVAVMVGEDKINSSYEIPQISRLVTENCKYRGDYMFSLTNLYNYTHKMGGRREARR